MTAPILQRADEALAELSVVYTSIPEQKARSSSITARLKQWTGVDRAVAFTVLARFWSALAGVITVLMIARFLTANEQGYYYTFFSIVALQIVFELGFSFVVLQLAAHERAALIITPDGHISGDSTAHSRLASVLQKTVRWYSVASLLMFASLLPAGMYFFSVHQPADAAVSWRGPWCLLVIVAILTFLLDPLFAFIEGCGFVTDIARLRLVQAFLGSILAWACMATHHGLYSPALLILGNAAAQIYFLSKPKLRHLLVGLLRDESGRHSVRWREEIWPFQWRIAITWLSSYFIVQFINPVLFAFRGPSAAGRMGMSISIAMSISSVGLSWMSTKASPFGTMIARCETARLDAVFFRTLWQSTGFVILASIGVFLCLATGLVDFLHLSSRLLPPWALALLLLTTIMTHIVGSEALYMRSHKREPLLAQGLISAIVIGIGTVILARLWGENAVTVGYFLFGGLLSLAWASYIFVTKRREWYGV